MEKVFTLLNGIQKVYLGVLNAVKQASGRLWVDFFYKTECRF